MPLFFSLVDPLLLSPTLPPPPTIRYPLPMLTALHLTVIRNDRLVLDNLSLTLAPGGAAVLLGRNGAGKSTLLRTLAGLRRPDAGELLWNHHPIHLDRDAHAARVAWLSHQDAIKPGLTTRENLAFAARCHGGDIDQALARLNLTDLADLPARMLSAGQKRRTALARMMLGNRPLWLLDEPTNGLDAASIALLARALAEHRAQGGMVIAATHTDLALPDAAVIQLGAA
jgi:heme exporter protein A